MHRMVCAVPSPRGAFAFHSWREMMAGRGIFEPGTSPPSDGQLSFAAGGAVAGSGDFSAF